MLSSVHLEERLQFLGSRQYFSLNAQHAIIVWCEPPLYQRDFSVFDFNPCDATGMNATARIEIEWPSHSREHGTMGMTTDDHLMGSLYPRRDPVFNFCPFIKVLRWTCWIFHSKYLQVLPEIPNKKPAQPPEAIIH